MAIKFTQSTVDDRSPVLDLMAGLYGKLIVESVIDQLKNISQIEHSRYRSVSNFILNLISGLIAYGLQPKKPAIIDASFSGLITV